MASLQVRWPGISVIKQKALDDANKMQTRVIEECNKQGKEIPQYQLSELIGKGSFGRVYKATSITTKQLVAVKIIDIDQSDTQQDPKFADTYSDLLKEINALKLLRDTGARNINHVIEALPVGQSMWMITEYCAGGSVATLMRPTAPGGLQEKWIIPILREVAEAIYWVHEQGIIHRDIKCANILITEIGDVQLCDFGVAGVIETKFDKRTTVIGTPHWMAPELFDPLASYGTEVDIWAFGAMIFEVASGLPPNVVAGMDFSMLGTYVKQNTPRLDGDQYSPGLKDLIAYCLQHDPRKRPTISQIQHHGYIFNTDEAYPTDSLSHLVRGFKLWEAQGGDRRSLFDLGGAQAPAEITAAELQDDEWNFSTTAAFDQQVFSNGEPSDVYEVYGSNVDFNEKMFEETARPQKNKGGRRRPPPQLPSAKAPLEKLFDPNTMSSYDDNSRAYYGRMFQIPPASDLPLRDDTGPAPDVRESLIDLDASLDGGALSNYVDMNTIRAGDTRMPIDYNDFTDPGPGADTDAYDAYDGDTLNGQSTSNTMVKDNRRTQDWKFPTTPAPAYNETPLSANPVATFKFPMAPEDPIGSDMSRPQLHHHPTEPIPPSSHFNDLAPPQPPTIDNRASMGSLIDLDMSMPDPITEYPRPSTSHSDTGSISGSEMGGTNPFELEKHASFYATPSSSYREPSIYVSDDSEFANAVSDFSYQQQPNDNYNHDQAQPNNGLGVQMDPPRPYSLSDFAGMDPEDIDGPTPRPSTSTDQYFPTSSSSSSPPEPSPSLFKQDSFKQTSLQKPISRPTSVKAGPSLPSLPNAPSPQVMQGQASTQDVKEELRRMAMSLSDHLSHANVYLSGLQSRR